MYRRAKRRAYEVLEVANDGDSASRIFDTVIIALIILNAVVIVVETMAPLAERASAFFWTFELVSIVIFLGEYILRVWSCTEDPAFARPVWGRMRFAVKPLILIDLFAILPFFGALVLPFFIQVDLRFLRALRLMKMFRLAKLGRYSESLSIVGAVLRSRREVLLSTLFAAFVLLFIASNVMYLAERDAQPNLFSSIPAAMWWGMVTLTTVGYGDLAPITPIGRVFGAFVALLGIGLFALPAGILGSAFVDEIEQRRSRQAKTAVCPHCGKILGDHPSPDA